MMTHLQVPAAEDTLVQDKCLSHKTGFRKFHIRVSIVAINSQYLFTSKPSRI